MTKHPSKPPSEPIGDILRRQRVEELGLGLRDMAKVLKVAPAHVTDLELGRRTPSEDLLRRIAEAYRIDIAVLRAGWQKPDEVVKQVATQDATAAAKVPEFLRTARDLSPEQWETIIKQAKRMTGDEGGQS
jgi:transcriptional regulator with XRE-family HTH domain